jgi:hypothetical protein
MTITFPCDCEAEEHEVEVEAEWGGYGIRGRTGLYDPREGDALECGRVLTSGDIEDIIKRIDESHYEEP